jgi:hypothetical protein
MNLNDRIDAISRLGTYLIGDFETEFLDILTKAEINNPWFTIDNQKQALMNIGMQLNDNNLNAWISPYKLKQNPIPEDVLIIMAGNIPLVGFYDLISVIVTGNNATVKMSSNDNILLPYLIKKLTEINIGFKQIIQFTDKVRGKVYNKIIATGSNISSRYFEYYFRDTSCLIRKNRRSIAILDGNEDRNELEQLGHDVFSYFGLGCRNVSKFYIPVGYDLDKLFQAFYSYRNIIEHLKYSNNYDYYKAILLMGNNKFMDNGFVILKEDSSLDSPVAIQYYQFYSNIEEVQDMISKNHTKLQCIVSREDVLFGEAQKPNLWDYSDGIDTIDFLIS